MRIVIDMSGACAPAVAVRDAGRRTRELVREVIRQAKVAGDEVFMVVDPNSPSECDRILRELEGLVPRTNVKSLDLAECPAEACGMDLSSGRTVRECLREWFLRQFEADVIWTTPLLIFDRKTISSPLRDWHLSRLASVRMTDLIAADSESSGRMLMDLTGIPARQIVVAGGSGCDSVAKLLSSWRGTIAARKLAAPKYGIRELACDLAYARAPAPIVERVAKAVVRMELFRPRRRVYVDVSGVVLCNFCSGIQRVANALALNLEKMSNDSFEAIPVFSDAWNPNFYRARLKDGRYARSETQPRNAVTFRDGDALLISDFHPASITTKADALQHLCRRGIDVVAVVYDLIPVDLPETYPPEFVRSYADYLGVVAKLSGILGISRASEDRFADWCRDAQIKFRPYFRSSHFFLGSDIRNAVPSKGLPDMANATLKTLAARPTFLAVSTIEPRKMHLQMLDAFDILWKKGIEANLVFVGRDGWKNDAIKSRLNEHPENGKRFFWLQGVSDEYLERIYAAASCVIMASRCEGFGLPIVEGARHGKPLILRDIPIFREVAGDHALYFTGTEGADLAKAVEQWLALRKCGKMPSSGGIRSFTWRESAEAVLDFLGLKGAR